jgi:hypothetical protein
VNNHSHRIEPFYLRGTRISLINHPIRLNVVVRLSIDLSNKDETNDCLLSELDDDGSRNASRVLQGSVCCIGDGIHILVSDVISDDLDLEPA